MSQLSTPSLPRAESNLNRRTPKMRLTSSAVVIVILLAQFSGGSRVQAEEILPGLLFEQGTINGVLVRSGEQTVAVYSEPVSSTKKSVAVLLTHHRRDVVAAAETAVAAGANVVAPEAERELFEATDEFWNDFWTKRFHDYAQQSTKILTEPLKVDRWVKDGDTFDAGGVTFRVLETPGFTRGAVSYIGETDPQEAIAKLIGRVEAYYRNYLSTNALNWYFKEERMTIKGRRVLGQDAEVKLMPLSVHEQTPGWIWENSTSRMLISDDGHGFLLDCGYQRVIDGVKQLMEDGLVKKVDGIFVTHYHDDHTNMVQAASEEFGCPIYSTLEYEDILENPGAYHMPATTDKAMKDVTGLKSGHKMKWKEYELEFQFYPGQTLYHGAVLVRRNGGTPYYFVGDAFSPSGMDDYCLLNRNLLHDDTGYPFCLKKIRELGSDYWLINEHIPYVFRFSEKELDYLETNLQKRKEILDELLPWDDINYGIDEQWATFYPRGVAAKVGKPIELQVRIQNHSPIARTFKVTPRKSHGVDILSKPAEITLQPRQSGSVSVAVSVRKAVTLPGTFVVTADIDSEGMHFLSWADAVIRVED
jgi:glyoxylase-like metal-dependent hydrolase (beta-lactamase superfamily II)